MVEIIQTEKAVIFTEKKDLPSALLRQVEQRLDYSSADGIVLGQFPCLNLGYIDPITNICYVPNPNAFAVSLKCYEELGEVDNRLRYFRAADYAYRMRQKGKKIVLATDIVFPVDKQFTMTEIFVDSILFSYKYSDRDEKTKSLRKIIKCLTHYDPTIGHYSRKELIHELPKVIGYIFQEACNHSYTPGTSIANYYEFAVIRGSYKADYKMSDDTPLVSLVLRTHNRPEVLRLTLKNLANLDYPNYEIILIEDGSPEACDMVHKEFSYMNIRYMATEKPVGRAVAANIGFRMAKGKWVNLIDDDDFFFPEHIRIGIDKATAEAADIVFFHSVALETISERNPYSFTTKKMHYMQIPRIDPFTMSTECKCSDNGVLFKKELLYRVGWMREDLDAHEDWSLWLRLMTEGKWTMVPYATCLFVNPYDEKLKERRTLQYSASDGKQFLDSTLVYNDSCETLRLYLSGALCDVEALIDEGLVDSYLEVYLSKQRYIAGDRMTSAFEKMVSSIRQRRGDLFTAADYHEAYCGLLLGFLGQNNNMKNKHIEQLKSIITESRRVTQRKVDERNNNG